MNCSQQDRRAGRTFTSFLLVLVFLMATGTASAFIDPPVLIPSSPVAGELITVSIHHGYCDAFVVPPYPQITQVGNDIHLLLATLHFDDPLWCQTPPSVTATFPIGSFPPGDYTLHVERFYDSAVPAPVYETLANFEFTVRGQESVALPAVGAIGSLLLIVGILAVVACRQSSNRRYRNLLLLFALLATPTGVLAQESPHVIEVLLSSAPGAPTPREVINWVETSPGISPPIEAFRTISPSDATFLLSYRANAELSAWIEENPDSARARLERFILVEYPRYFDAEAALATLRNDPLVESAYVSEPAEFSSTALQNFSFGEEAIEEIGGVGYGWSTLNLDAAWFRATGYALVGIVDTGLYVDHPALRQFSATGQHIGGNFISAASLDVGGSYTSDDFNVDEQQPEPITDPACNPGGLPGVPTTLAGHGTHVAGLVGANVFSGLGFKGTCKNCGIAMARIAYGICSPSTGQVQTTFTFATAAKGITWLVDSGTQVINMSLGNSLLDPADYCPTHTKNVWCVAMAYATDRDVTLVGASGNWRIRLQFPAADSRVVAVGGYDESIAFWDESPGSYTFCPYGTNQECGSNFTNSNGPLQEVVAGSKSILSSMYPGKNWVPDLSCGDAFGTPMGDGVGLCTGTSMSSPLVAGVIGILRSVNPLVPASRPVPPAGQVSGIRTVLANTTFQAQSSIPWGTKFGYGRPDANAAVGTMLGNVAGTIVKNRVTPLFRLYGTTAKDYLDTTSPQFARSALDAVGLYSPQGATVSAYPAFPNPSGSTPLPRANVYVLVTEYKPRPSWPDLVPIYLADRGRYFPQGCQGASGCNITGQDFTLLTTKVHIEQARTAGYNLRNIQGYIYQACTPEPSCIPPAAEKFYRACKSSDGDCATFLESERVAFEAQGYTAAFPVGSNKVLGYAYPAVDTDGDGLVDGFEYVVGTNIYLKDSDGDGSCTGGSSLRCDGDEFPMVGVPISDPCDGPGAGNCPAVDLIFKHGFE